MGFVINFAAVRLLDWQKAQWDDLNALETQQTLKDHLTKVTDMKTLLQLAIVFLFATPAFTQDLPQKTAEVEGVSEYRLSNGCRVVLYPDASSKAVTVNMTVLVGSRHEGYGETGMAHLLEHMLFQGTPKHGDLDGELKERGALDMNGDDLVRPHELLRNIAGRG